jgi:hypothetical protein
VRVGSVEACAALAEKLAEVPDAREARGLVGRPLRDFRDGLVTVVVVHVVRAL